MDTASETTPKPELTREPDFRLGVLEVSPSACRVRGPGGEQRVEPRVMEVLVVLVRAQGRTISRDQLVEACWDGRIVSDDAIARTIAKVRALARLAEPAPFELATIPKVGFRLTPADGATEAPAPVARPSRRSPGRLAMAAVVLAALALAALAATLWLRRGGELAQQSGRVEVVRMEARTADPAMQRFAAEMGDAILRTLAGSGVETAPHLAAPDRGGSGFDAELRITGAVTRRGEAQAVDLQVLDRRSGMVLFTLARTRPAASEAGFPDEVAETLAGYLKCALEDRRSSRRRMEPAVLGLYLHTCGAVGNPQRMVEFGRRLVEAAPDLAIAHAMYGIAQAHAQDIAATPEEAAAYLRGARESGRRAVQLDPRTVKGYLALSISAPRLAWLEQEENLLKARAIDPHLSAARVGHLDLLRNVGRVQEAVRLADQMVASGDPRNLGHARIAQLQVAVQAGDMARARRLAGELMVLDPESADAARWMLASAGADPAADLVMLRALKPERISPTALACIQAFLERLTSGAAGQKGLPPACDRAAPARRIHLLARQGDLDAAFAEAARVDAPYVFFYPEMREMRRDPRFMALAARYGLTAYWLKSARWPDFCREPDPPYDCRREAEKAQSAAGRAAAA